MVLRPLALALAVTVLSTAGVVAAREPARPIDVCFVAEGFEEEASFLAAARRHAETLTQGELARPVREAGIEFRFHHRFRRSRSAAPGDTVFGAYVSDAMLMVPGEPRAVLEAEKVAPGRDVVTVTLVRLRPGQRGRPNAGLLERRLVVQADEEEALLHELAHAVFGLGDEYTDADLVVTPPGERDAVSNRIALQPNLTVFGSDPRFAATAGSKRVYLGGDRYSDVFHSAPRCLMGGSRLRGHTDPLCRVCLAVVREWARFGPRATPRAPHLDTSSGTPSWRPAREGPPAHRFELELVRLGDGGRRVRVELPRFRLEGHERALPRGGFSGLAAGAYELSVRAGFFANLSEAAVHRFSVAARAPGLVGGVPR